MPNCLLICQNLSCPCANHKYDFKYNDNNNNDIKDLCSSVATEKVIIYVCFPPQIGITWIKGAVKNTFTHLHLYFTLKLPKYTERKNIALNINVKIAMVK